MTLDTRNRIISIVLAIVIIGLGYWLYHSIVDPYEKVVQKEQMTQKVRYRMGNIRDALIRYERKTDSFPPSNGGLDTLVQYLKTDSVMQLQADSLFAPINSSKEFNPDSLIHSPRPPHKKFEYSLNDTLRPAIYLLKDPDSEDKIGSLENTTQLNAGSWE
ncbi:MAG TPA: hypothetical protein VK112_13225 [Fodinibius sp.]|nr:hypothetical protein [Fodinibius sp.]